MPDPNEYREMRKIHEAGEGPVAHGVGDCGATGRVKTGKKWMPKKSEEAFGKVDDWVGASPTGQRRSWKVKTSTTKHDDHSETSDPVASPSPTRKWKPPAKTDATFSPPWMASPTQTTNNNSVSSPSPTRKWQPPAKTDASFSPPWVTSPSGTSKKSPSKWSKATSPSATKTTVTSTLPVTPNLGSESHHSESYHSIDDGKPNPAHFLEMRKAQEGDTKGVDHGVGDCGATGRVKTGKKWMPEKTEDRFGRVDDWLGASPTGQKKSYKVKSVSTKPILHDSDPEEEAASEKHAPSGGRQWQSTSGINYNHPEPEPVTKSHIVSPKSPAKEVTKKVPSPAPSPVKSTSPVHKPEVHNDNDDGRPDPEEYRAMLRSHLAGDTSHDTDDFVGSYSNTGRAKTQPKRWSAPEAKPAEETTPSSPTPSSPRPDPAHYLEMRKAHEGETKGVDHGVGDCGSTGRVKTGKKWQPTKSEERFGRVDDWLGASPTGQKKSYKIKSVSTKPILHDSDPEEEAASEKHTPSGGRQWQSTSGINYNHHEPEPVTKSHIVSPKSPAKEVTKKVPSPAPSPVKSTSPVHKPEVHKDDDDGRPDPEEYRAMLRSHLAGDTSHDTDDFVGSYSNTGRAKTQPKRWSAPEAKPAEETTPSSPTPSSPTPSSPRPDPAHYLEMRKAHEGETKGVDHGVGDCGSTGRVKTGKKWQPTKSEERFARVDDWLGGSPKNAKKSYKVKSVSTKPIQHD